MTGEIIALETIRPDPGASWMEVAQVRADGGGFLTFARAPWMRVGDRVTFNFADDGQHFVQRPPPWRVWHGGRPAGGGGH